MSMSEGATKKGEVLPHKPKHNNGIHFMIHELLIKQLIVILNEANVWLFHTA